MKTVALFAVVVALFVANFIFAVENGSKKIDDRLSVTGKFEKLDAMGGTKSPVIYIRVKLKPGKEKVEDDKKFSVVVKGPGGESAYKQITGKQINEGFGVDPQKKAEKASVKPPLKGSENYRVILKDGKDVVAESKEVIVTK